jgi:phosphonate transport system substrate-binding protein
VFHGDTAVTATTSQASSKHAQTVLRLAAWMVLSCIFMSPVHADTTEPLTIGVHPFLPATTLIERFSPLAQYLSDRLQRSVRISVSSDYEEHIRATGEGRFDIAFLGPAPYVKVVEQYGPQRLLARM